MFGTLLLILSPKNMPISSRVSCERNKTTLLNLSLLSTYVCKFYVNSRLTRKVLALLVNIMIQKHFRYIK